VLDTRRLTTASSTLRSHEYVFHTRCRSSLALIQYLRLRDLALDIRHDDRAVHLFDLSSCLASITYLIILHATRVSGRYGAPSDCTQGDSALRMGEGRWALESKSEWDPRIGRAMPSHTRPDLRCLAGALVRRASALVATSLRRRDRLAEPVPSSKFR
jgi:hypothetical protein